MASSYGSDASKTSIRSLYLTTRAAMPSFRKDSADAAIRMRLEALDLWQDAPLVLAFVSYRDEIDTHAIIADAFAQGKKVAVPLCDLPSRSMAFHYIESLDELVPGIKGIPEPLPDTLIVKLSEMLGSICLVPGLVFDGAGYRMACALGHTLTPTRPSLVPLESDDAFCRDLQGFSLKNVTLRVYEDDKLIFRELGEMLFTHFGVSGPLVLSASAHMRQFSSCTYRLEIDLKPGLDEEKLDARILRDFAAQPNKTLANLMPGLTGRSMAPVVLSLAGVDGSIPANTVTHAQRAAIRQVLKAFPVSVSGTRSVDEAIVTAGGISTKEVNPRTMESKIVPGLYFAGEILDVDAYTGGFNLQIAWATGYTAGTAVCDNL